MIFELSDDEAREILDALPVGELKATVALRLDPPPVIVGKPVVEEDAPDAQHRERTLFCPHCGEQDQIVDVDYDSRWNRLSEWSPPQAHAGRVYVTFSYNASYGNYDTDHYRCDGCGRPVSFPDNVTVQ